MNPFTKAKQMRYAAILLSLFQATRLLAATQTWDNGSGDFLWDGSSTNWGGAVWTAGNDAIFGATGVGTITLSGTQTVGTGTDTPLTFSTAGYTLTGGTLALPGAGFSSTIEVDADANIASIVSDPGTGSVLKTGVGTLTLNPGSGNTDAMGSLAVDAGTLALTSGTLNVTTTGGANAGGTGNGLVISGATLSIAGGTNSTSGYVSINNGGTLAISSGTFYEGGAEVLNGYGSPSTITLSGGLMTAFYLHAGFSGGTVNLNGGTLQLNGFVASGPGTVNLNGGTIQALSPSGNFMPVNNTYNVLSGGAIFDTAGNDIGVPAPLLAGITDGGLTKLGAGNLTLSGTNTFTGPTTISGGTLTIGDPGQLGGGAYGAVITDNAAFNYASSAAQTLAGVISGTGSLTSSGTNTLVLSGANTYTGSTTVGAGTLQLGPVAVTIPNYGFETPVVPNYTYTPSGGSWSFDSQSGIDNNDNVFHATACPQGTQCAFIQGSGTFSNTITVTTPGVYVISFEAEGRGGGAGPDGIIVQVDGTTVGTWPATAISTTAWQTYSSNVLVTAGSHTLAFLGNNTLGGDKSSGIDNVQMYSTTSYGTLPTGTAVNVSAAGATLDLQGTSQTIGSLAGGGGGSVLDNGSLTVGGDNTSTVFAGVISGSGTLTKLGTGTLTFSGANTYTGGTTVSAGTLAVNGANTGPGLVTVNAGATLAGTGSLVGAVSVQDGGTLAPGSGTLTVGSLTLGTNATLALTLGAATNSSLLVNGNLVLNGHLLVNDAGGMSTGTVYSVIHYTGALTNLGLTQDANSAWVVSVDTSLTNYVRLTAVTKNPFVSITNGNRAVSALTINLGGVLNRPFSGQAIWYEVCDQTNKMWDFGATLARTPWSITVRHLRAGTNTVTVFAQDAFGTIQSNRVQLTLTLGAAPAVRPRPVPAEIWWGGVSDNTPMTNFSQWQYVQQYEDGYFFHSAGSWPVQQLAADLIQYNTKYWPELGGDCPNPSTNWYQSQTNTWGGWAASMQNAGIIWSEFTHDYHMENMQPVCQVNPTWATNDEIAWWTGDLTVASTNYPYSSGIWRDVFNGYYQMFPQIKVGQSSSPVWFPWGSYPEEIPGDNELAFTVTNPTTAFSFNAQAIFASFINMAGAIGHPYFSLQSDTPWDYFGGNLQTSATNEAVMRQKIRAYEQYLQSRNCRHTLICNVANVSVQNQGSTNAADLYYETNSLNSMYLHQQEGGRANRYLFESWFVGIPYLVVPETQAGTYTHLALTAIKYLKGIADTNGTLEPLALGVPGTGGAVNQISLTNNGDIACLPALTASETGSSNLVTHYYNSASQDITTAMLSAEGYSPTNLVSPGQSLTFTMLVSALPGAAPTDSRTTTLEAFWNPQDPTGVVRDRQTVSVSAAVLPPPNLIVNGDFTANAAGFTNWPGYILPWSSGNPAAITGWTDLSNSLAGVNGAATSVGDPFGPSGTGGRTYAFIQGGVNGLAQNLSLSPGTTYQLNYDVAVRAGNTASYQVQIADNTQTYYSSGSVLGNSAAFVSITNIFTTPATLNGTPAIQLLNLTGGDNTVDFANVSLINAYTLTYNAGANGTISGTSPQTVGYGASGSAVTAVPNTGYHFVDWSDGSVANPRTDVNVTSNLNVTANFAINTYTLTYNAGANGTLSGTSPQTVNYGASGSAVTAVPDTGYHFVNWSDGSIANPRTDVNVTSNLTVTANFAINAYVLTYNAWAGGTISGISPQTVNYGASGTAVTAVPNMGYYFTTWSDGSVANPRTDVNVTSNLTVTANFAAYPAPVVALTSPTNNATYILPATITLAATVTTNGNTISQIQFYYGGTNLIGAANSAPFTYAWTNPPFNSYTLTARLVYNGSQTLDSAGVSITVLGLPAPWLTADIGSGIVAGSAFATNSAYNVEGAGNISGTADNFRFVYQALNADGEIRARIPAFAAGTSARIGVMMRDTLTASARTAFMGVDGSGNYYAMYRATTGGTLASKAAGSGTAPSVWVRLLRSGNSVSAYKSSNGSTWKTVGTYTVTMATNCYFGLSVSSGTTNTLNAATFDTLTVIP